MPPSGLAPPSSLVPPSGLAADPRPGRDRGRVVTYGMVSEYCVVSSALCMRMAGRVPSSTCRLAADPSPGRDICCADEATHLALQSCTTCTSSCGMEAGGEYVCNSCVTGYMGAQISVRADSPGSFPPRIVSRTALKNLAHLCFRLVDAFFDVLQEAPRPLRVLSISHLLRPTLC